MFARKRCERLRRQTSRRSLARWSRVEGRWPVHLPTSWPPIRKTGGQLMCKDARHHHGAPAARPRRRGDRMSNCVVGSGGLRLPCSTTAEHSVEGCDHFSHDGDDDDLGFFVGVGEAIVEGFEGGTVSACAEGGHVEDITDRHPTTVDAAVSLKLAAVEVIGCEADEGGDLLIFPSSGNRAMSVKASTGPTPGIEVSSS